MRRRGGAAGRRGLDRAPPTLRHRRTAPGDRAVSDIVGSVLLLAIAVGLVATFTWMLFTTPPPVPQPHAHVQAFILPREPDTVVLEHQGGKSIPYQDLLVDLQVNAVNQRVNAGQVLADPTSGWSAWTDGSATAGNRFRPGDQLRYQHPTVRGASVEIAVVDVANDASILPSSRLASRDVTAPGFLSARTTTRTTIEVVLDEALHSLTAADLRVDGVQPTSAVLVGDGSRAVLTVPAFNSGATPLVESVVAPAETRDLAGNLFVPADALCDPAPSRCRVVAADGVAPAITNAGAGPIGERSATVFWETDEGAQSRVHYGLTNRTMHLTASDGLFSLDHATLLNRLTPQTLYFYWIESPDAAGNTQPPPHPDDARFFITGLAPRIPVSVDGSILFLELALPAAQMTAGTTLQGLEVTIRDQDGAAILAPWDVTVYLQTPSDRGSFRTPAGAETNFVVIRQGEAAATFGYYDEKADEVTLLAAAVGFIGDGKSLAVRPAAQTAWRTPPVGLQQAGVEFNFTIEAIDAFGNRVRGYSGSPSFILSGATGRTGFLPQAGVANATTNFGVSTGPFSFVDGRSSGKMRLYAAETAHVLFRDAATGFSNADDPLIVSVVPAAIGALRLHPDGQTVGTALWSGRFEIVVEDLYGNPLPVPAPLDVTLASPGGVFADMPLGPTKTVFTIPGGGSSFLFYGRWDTSGTRTLTASIADPPISTVGTVHVLDVPTAHHLAFITTSDRIDSGIASARWVVELRNAAGIAVPPGTPLIVNLSTNSTRGLFLHATEGSVITNVVIAPGETRAEFRYVDYRKDSAHSVVVVFARNTVPDASAVYVAGRGGSNIVLDRVQAFVMLPNLLRSSQEARLGISIVNPTPDNRNVVSVTFRTEAPLNVFDLLRHSPSNGDWNCALPVGKVDRFTCTPTSPVPLRAFEMTQAVFVFNVNGANGASVVHTTVQLQNAEVVVAPKVNIRLTNSGGVVLSPISTEGDPIAGWYGLPSGGLSTLRYAWTFGQGQASAQVYTRINIPPGWGEIRLVTSPGDATVAIREPTNQEPGLIFINSAWQPNTSHEIAFEVRTPSIEGVDVITFDVQATGTPFLAFWSSGVSIS